MNIRKDEAGYVTDAHIRESGFVSYKTHEGVGYELTDFHKNGKLFLTGGYWTYYLKDKFGRKLWEGWWNSNEEFDQTIAEIEKLMHEQRTWAVGDTCYMRIGLNTMKLMIYADWFENGKTIYRLRKDGKDFCDANEDMLFKTIESMPPLI